MSKTKNYTFQTDGILGLLQFNVPGFKGFDCLPGPGHLKAGKVLVKELDESGNVNLLYIENNSEDWVLFTDSDLLQGAKQNRVLNASALLAPHGKYKIDVSCVEHGRWSHVSPVFSATDHQVDMDMRINKNRNVSKSKKVYKRHLSDQQEVWANVSSKLHASGTSSNTDDYMDYLANEPAQAKDKFKYDERCHGLAVFFQDHLVSAEIFGNKDLLRFYFRRTIQSANRVARFQFGSDPNKKSHSLNSEDAQEAVQRFLGKTLAFPYEMGKGMAEGKERTWSDPELSGFSLRQDEHVVHEFLYQIQD